MRIGKKEPKLTIPIKQVLHKATLNFEPPNQQKEHEHIRWLAHDSQLTSQNDNKEEKLYLLIVSCHSLLSSQMKKEGRKGLSNKRKIN